MSQVEEENPQEIVRDITDVLELYRGRLKQETFSTDLMHESVEKVVNELSRLKERDIQGRDVPSYTLKDFVDGYTRFLAALTLEMKEHEHQISGVDEETIDGYHKGAEQRFKNLKKALKRGRGRVGREIFNIEGDLAGLVGREWKDLVEDAEKIDQFDLFVSCQQHDGVQELADFVEELTQKDDVDLVWSSQDDDLYTSCIAKED